MTAIGSEMETKPVKASGITFDIHGRVDTVIRQPERYLREVTEIRKESPPVTVELQEITPEEIWLAMQIAKEAGQRNAEVWKPAAAPQAAVGAKAASIVATETRAGHAGIYKPDYPAHMITAPQAAPMEFRFSGTESIEAQTESEFISVPSTRITGVPRLNQKFIRDPNTGNVEPAFSSTIILGEKENEPARRRPKAPEKERKQKDYDSKSILWRARALAAKKEKGC